MNTPNETNVDKPRACFQTSADTIIVAKRLLKLEPGEILTKEQCANLVPGCDLFGDRRGIMTSAVKYVQKNHGIIIASIRKVGVKRLLNDEIPSISDSATRHIRRTSKRTAAKIACADYDALNNESKKKYNESLTILGTINHFAAPKTVQAVSDAVEKSSTRLSISDVVNLDHFKK